MRLMALLGALGFALTHGPDTWRIRAHQAVVGGLDHVPIAVNDLERAAAGYRRLGFALKPGRPHDNGIRNQHVKFRDGTELELITAPDARDALTRTYRRRSWRRRSGTSSSAHETHRRPTGPNISRIRTPPHR
jgi:hypothetical protein